MSEEAKNPKLEHPAAPLPAIPLAPEPLIFELSRPGKLGFQLKEPEEGEVAIPEHLLRTQPPRLPQVSEPEVIRHFHRLAQRNYSIDTGIYPLGSCTMKYNPRINEAIASLPGFSSLHPLTPEEGVQGALEVQWLLEQYLCRITGMAAATLQPAAGAHGELTGLLLIRAYFQERGEERRIILVPDSAHGTNPATAAQVGFELREIPTKEQGILTPELLKPYLSRDVAALMLTNPNTLGLFERHIGAMAELLHREGAFLYMDGANMNAFLGIMQPGKMGVDLMHINLHKTFSTPHGGGGPGSGPVCVQEVFEPYLPVPRVVRDAQGYRLDWDRPRSLGMVKAFPGQFGMHVRALAYLWSYGGKLLAEIARRAILNANYLRKALEGELHLPYPGPVMHEVVFSDRTFKERGVTTLDLAKRLLDYGVHPPTIYFPLVISGALMIEPTETESLTELERFVAALKEVLRESQEHPELLRDAPFSTPVGRLDEALAARNPVVRAPLGEEPLPPSQGRGTVLS